MNPEYALDPVIYAYVVLKLAAQSNMSDVFQCMF